MIKSTSNYESLVPQISWALLYLVVVAVMSVAGTTENANSCTSVVLYTNTAANYDILGVFAEKSRSLAVGQYNIVISQDWDVQGLSAVVWNAVSFISFEGL